jgi:hypothetical protein
MKSINFYFLFTLASAGGQKRSSEAASAINEIPVKEIPEKKERARITELGKTRKNKVDGFFREEAKRNLDASKALRFRKSSQSNPLEIPVHLLALDDQEDSVEEGVSEGSRIENTPRQAPSRGEFLSSIAEPWNIRS